MGDDLPIPPIRRSVKEEDKKEFVLLGKRSRLVYSREVSQIGDFTPNPRTLQDNPFSSFHDRNDICAPKGAWWQIRPPYYKKPACNIIISRGMMRTGFLRRIPARSRMKLRVDPKGCLGDE